MAKKDKVDRKRKREDTDAADAPDLPVAEITVLEDSIDGEVPEEKTKTKKDKKKSVKASAVEEDVSAINDDTAADDDAAAAAAGADAEAEVEVEVLSHKEQRKRRRLEKRAASLAANAANKDESAGPAKANTGSTVQVITSSSASSASKPAPRSEYAVWVGNLAFGTTPQRLQSWLEDKCVAGITRINMPKGARRHEQNKGFAYVDLPDETTLKYCISLSESPLEGRRLLIKDAKNFEGRPALSISAAAFATDDVNEGTQEATNAAGKSNIALPPGAELLQNAANASLGKFAQSTLRSQKNAPSRTLFVGNLPFAATMDGLRDVLRIAEERKLEGERDRIEAMELKEMRRRRKEEKEKKREEALLAKAQGKDAPAAVAKKEAENEEEEDTSDEENAEADDGDGDGDGDESSSSEEESDDGSSDDDDQDDAKADAEQKTDESPSKAKAKPDKVKDAANQDPIGLVKIRLATFEDNPEKCKGFAFLDFASTLHATRVLINPRNRFYLARKLIYEYAGEEAQRRSGGAKKRAAAEADAPAVDGYNEGRGGNSEWKRQRMAPAHKARSAGPRSLARAKKMRAGKGANAPAVSGDEGGSAPVAISSSSSKPSQAERAAARLAKGRGRADDRARAGAGGGGRPAASSAGAKREKPGAALANAARGKVGIVASEGKKITFE
ncbi:hypothetical protein V8E36_005824 [Tilletia maclaganii]